MTAIRFYDSTVPADVPAGATHFAAYADGEHRATGRQVARFPNLRWITIVGDPSVRIADAEPLNPVWDNPRSLRSWAASLQAQDRGTPIVYVQRSLAAEAILRLDGIRVHWWIPTLDGKDWTAEDLAADLAANWDAPIPASRIWANQNINSESPVYDRSNLFLGWRA